MCAKLPVYVPEGHMNAALKRNREVITPSFVWTVGHEPFQPGMAAACLTQATNCFSSKSSSWTLIQRASLLLPPGGSGLSDVPMKKVSFTDFSKTWKLRNQPSPSTP